MAKEDAVPAVGIPIDQSDPKNLCFGCSPHNEHGMRMTFARTAARVVESRYTVPAHFCGAPNVVQGGIQAVMLDEALGFACRAAFVDPADEAFGNPGNAPMVTAELSLRYRIPVPTGELLLIRGEAERLDGRNIFARGAIVDEKGRELTRAEGRFVRLET